MGVAESWEIWKEGCIKEVAQVYNEIYGITNITYETHPEFVVFLTEGFLLAMHFRNNKKREMPGWGKEALHEEVAFHTNFLKELEE